MWRKLLALALVPWLASAKTEVSFLFSYDPNHPEMPATRRILELVKSEPEIAPVRWGGLSLPGGGGRTAFTLALAADSAPDVYLSWFHILRHDVEQGFVYPLDEWLSEGELRAEPSDLWDRVRRYDGHVWALPTPGVAYYGIVYRKDLVAAAGLDPECPPRTWSAFRDWCEKLTVPASGSDPGRQAFAIENRAWGFLPWVQSAGGDVIRVRDTGDEVRGTEAYEACFDSPAALKAAGYLQDLVRRGVVRGLPNLTKTDEIGRLFQSGEIVSVFGGEDLVRRLTETLHLPAKNIGLMPFPAADEGGVRVLQAHRHFYAMSESVRRRPKAERDRVWQCLCALASPELADEEVRRNVDEGRLQWCRPSDLRRLGYGDRLGEVPAGIREMYDDLERGEIKAVTEPWVGFWQAAGDLVQRRFLGLLLSSASGKHFDYAAALASITEDANRGLMFDSDRSRVDAARPYARIVFGALLACALVAAGLVWKVKRPAPGASAPPHLRTSESPNLRTSAPRARSRALAPWLFLAPAVLSILVWSYYPLVRGGVMAFQDYRIVGSSAWTGLDNFIRVSCDPGFWAAWGRTLEYVAITLLFGFFTPILLAVMLCEIPRGKILFRFLYFLPHLTSALVVTLLWKLMFAAGPDGILNRAFALFGVAPHDWLQDPAWAMVCCILPGVWAGAGISSLIYIAAIESLPRDYYEAAALDGAGILARFRHITFPQIAPLMVINFVGSFIAAFQGMGSIFLLTFGGPGDATQVVSLQIWKEAYINLRFSTATTMAWYLGVALIAFTYLQIRLLRRVEFRQAAAN